MDFFLFDPDMTLTFSSHDLDLKMTFIYTKQDSVEYKDVEITSKSP